MARTWPAGWPPPRHACTHTGGTGLLGVAGRPAVIIRRRQANEPHPIRLLVACINTPRQALQLGPLGSSSALLLLLCTHMQCPDSEAACRVVWWEFAAIYIFFSKKRLQRSRQLHFHMRMHAFSERRKRMLWCDQITNLALFS